MFIDYFLSLWKKEKFDRVHVVCCESSLCAVVVAICPDNTHLCTKEAFGKIFLEVFGVEFEKELLCSAQIAIFEQMQNGVISFDEVLQSLHVLEQNMIVKSE